jgi:excisionase family DNA binding protein
MVEGSIGDSGEKSMQGDVNFLQHRDRLLSVEEVAEAMYVSEATVWRWVKQHRVPFIRVGCTIRFNPDLLSQWLQEGCPARLFGEGCQ